MSEAFRYTSAGDDDSDLRARSPDKPLYVSVLWRPATRVVTPVAEPFEVAPARCGELSSSPLG